jgi:nicotinate (nicotinamide) nucleotide adenylyltransferase
MDPAFGTEADLRAWIQCNASTIFDSTDPAALPSHGCQSVGLFGLSANPPHMGHVRMLEYFASMGYFDEIWILPVAAHMFDYKKNQAPFHHRLKMCQLAADFAKTDGCTVRALSLEQVALRASTEISGKQRIGTAALLHFVRFIYGPPVKFSFLMGQDTYEDLAVRNLWTNGAYILATTPLYVMARREEEMARGEEEEEKSNVDDGRVVTFHRLDTGGGNCSSTAVRKFLANHRDLIATDLPPAVLKYCLDEGLYTTEEEASV